MRDSRASLGHGPKQHATNAFQNGRRALRRYAGRQDRFGGHCEPPLLLLAHIDPGTVSVQYIYCPRCNNMTDFRTLAEALADDIASASWLRGPGFRRSASSRMPRDCGFDGDACYADLVHRGLVAGEIGRGTYVRSPSVSAGTALAEPRGMAMDLELNFPILPFQGAQMVDGLAALFRPGSLDEALRRHPRQRLRRPGRSRRDLEPRWMEAWGGKRTLHCERPTGDRRLLFCARGGGPYRRGGNDLSCSRQGSQRSSHVARSLGTR